MIKQTFAYLDRSTSWEKMTENIEECEMLPIPPELLAESQKSIGIVMDSGVLIDLNQQGKLSVYHCYWKNKTISVPPLFPLTLDTNEWNRKYAGSLGPLATTHPEDCFVKHCHIEEGLPLREIQEKLGVTDPQQILCLLNEPCGIYKNHLDRANYLYQKLPRK